MTHLELIKTVVRDIRKDCESMEKCNPDGRQHSWAARFLGYAAAIEGHLAASVFSGQVLADRIRKEEDPDMDDDFVPMKPQQNVQNNSCQDTKADASTDGSDAGQEEVPI